MSDISHIIDGLMQGIPIGLQIRSQKKAEEERERARREAQMAQNQRESEARRREKDMLTWLQSETTPTSTAVSDSAPSEYQDIYNRISAMTEGKTADQIPFDLSTAQYVEPSYGDRPTPNPAFVDLVNSGMNVEDIMYLSRMIPDLTGEPLFSQAEPEDTFDPNVFAGYIDLLDTVNPEVVLTLAKNDPAAQAELEAFMSMSPETRDELVSGSTGAPFEWEDAQTISQMMNAGVPMSTLEQFPEFKNEFEYASANPEEAQAIFKAYGDVNEQAFNIAWPEIYGRLPDEIRSVIEGSGVTDPQLQAAITSILGGYGIGSSGGGSGRRGGGGGGGTGAGTISSEAIASGFNPDDWVREWDGQAQQYFYRNKNTFERLSADQMALRSSGQEGVAQMESAKFNQVAYTIVQLLIYGSTDEEVYQLYPQINPDSPEYDSELAARVAEIAASYDEGQ